ncbi:MAG: orotidine 5'-phosphate decarboxylase, partial [Euryarchaeota archaeon]|nr:orotidine 5'-phosphate decarboxylase [Euryarchaeota archaeon]
PESVVIADLKTLDTGHLEARIASDATADTVTVSGLAPQPTIEKFIEECKKVGAYSMIDMLNVPDPLTLLQKLKVKPNIVELHRGIDTEASGAKRGLEWGNIPQMKKACGGKLLVGVAGGIRVDKVPQALESGADILVVGRAITNAKDVTGAARAFLQAMKLEELDQFRVMTDF